MAPGGLEPPTRGASNAPVVEVEAVDVDVGAHDASSPEKSRGRPVAGLAPNPRRGRGGTRSYDASDEEFPGQADSNIVGTLSHPMGVHAQVPRLRSPTHPRNLFPDLSTPVPRRLEAREQSIPRMGYGSMALT